MPGSKHGVSGSLHALRAHHSATNALSLSLSRFPVHVRIHIWTPFFWAIITTVGKGSFFGIEGNQTTQRRWGGWRSSSDSATFFQESFSMNRFPACMLSFWDCNRSNKNMIVFWLFIIILPLPFYFKIANFTFRYLRTVDRLPTPCAALSFPSSRPLYWLICFFFISADEVQVPRFQ